MCARVCARACVCVCVCVCVRACVGACVLSLSAFQDCGVSGSHIDHKSDVTAPLRLFAHRLGEKTLRVHACGRPVIVESNALSVLVCVRACVQVPAVSQRPSCEHPQRGWRTEVHGGVSH
eukprot:2078690-Pleurochrysis_carterae.AAC.1